MCSQHSAQILLVAPVLRGLPPETLASKVVCLICGSRKEMVEGSSFASFDYLVQEYASWFDGEVSQSYLGTGWEGSTGVGIE